MKWMHHLATAAGIVLMGSALAGAQTQQSTQWQATQTFLQNMQAQINALRGQNGPGVLPGAAGQFAGYNTNGTVISPMPNPVGPGGTGQFAGYTSGNTIGPIPNPVLPGTTGQMAGYSANGSVVGPVGGALPLDPINAGADPTGVNDSTAAFQNTINQACPGAPNANCTKPIHLSPGSYRVSSLNFTNLYGLSLIGSGSTGVSNTYINCYEPTDNTGICLDFSGDIFHTIRDLAVQGVAGHDPQVMVMLAKTNLNNSDQLYWDNVAILSPSSSPGSDWGIYNFGGELWHCVNCQTVGQYNKGSILLSYANTPGIESSYATTENSTSMTSVDLHAGSFSSSGTGPAIVFDSGPAGVGDISVTGYCNTANNVPCFGEYSSADTGGINNLAIGPYFRHEPMGSSPGPLLELNYATTIGLKIIGASWDPAVSSVPGPAVLLNGSTYAADIDVNVGESVSTVVSCAGGIAGHNNTGTVIHDYNFVNYQHNTCPGAAEIGGMYGSSAGAEMKAPTFTGNPEMISISGGGAFNTGSNSFSGIIAHIAATGNTLTEGFFCPNFLAGTFYDETSNSPVTVTGRSDSRHITFSGTAGHQVDYFLSCN